MPIASGAGTLTANATGYVPANGYQASVTITTGANIKDAALTPNTLTGVLRDSISNDPLPAATVVVTDSAGNVYTSSTNANGTYAFTSTVTNPLVPGTATVYGTAIGYGSATVTKTLTPGSNTQDVSLGALTLLGVVTDRNNGLPIPGAIVAVRDSAGHTYTRTTDINGSYVFTSTTAAPLVQGLANVTGSAGGYSDATATPTLVSGANIQHLTLACTTLSGVVTDTVTGLPITGASVIFTDAQSHVFTTTTSVDGRFFFTSTLITPIGTGAGTLNAYHPGYVMPASYVPTTTIVAGENVKNALLTPQGSVSGKVYDDVNGNGQDDSEAGIPGVALTLTLSTGQSIGTSANASGYYTFSAVPSGAFTVTVGMAPPGYVATSAGNLSGTLGAGDPSGGHDFGFQLQADVSITKTDGLSSITPGASATYQIVVDNHGPANVSGATVVDDLPSAFTSGTWTCLASAGATCPAGGDGTISVTVNLNAGARVTFIVNAALSASASGTVRNTAAVTLPLGIRDTLAANNSATDNDSIGATALVGVIRDRLSSLPISGAVVTVTDSLNHIYTTTTGVDGSYGFTNTAGAPLVAGLAIVDASATGYAPAQATLILVSGVTNTRDLVLMPTSLTGSITDSNTHAAIPGANVVVTDSAGHVIATTTDANGVYVITSTVANPLSAGVADVVASATGYLPAAAHPALIAGTLNHQDLSLVRMTPILGMTKRAGLLIDADGNHVPSPGDTLVYTIVVSNTGTGIASAAIFDDIPDNNTTLSTGSVTTTLGNVITGNTSGDSQISVALGDIAVHRVITLQFQVLINNPLPAGVSQVSNQGTLRSNELPAVLSDDPTTPAGADPTVTPVTAAPVLAASKTVSMVVDADHNGIPSPGDELLYQVTLANRGNAAATGVTYRDTPDANAPLLTGTVQTSAGTIISGNAQTDSSVAVGFGTLNGANTSVTVTYRARIVNPIPLGIAELSNQGLLSSDQLPMVSTDDPGTPAAGDPTISPVTAAPVLAAEKTASLLVDADNNGVPSAGDTLLYHVTIANSGNTAASEVIFSDIPATNTTLLSGTVQVSAGTVITGNHSGDSSVYVSLGILPANDSATLSFQVKVNNPLPSGVTQVANQGFVSSKQVPTVPTDDPSTPTAGDPTVTSITPTPLIIADKMTCLCIDADHDGVASPGDGLLYRIAISNKGNVAATSVVFRDVPDANTTLNAGTVKVSAGTIITGNQTGDAEVLVDIGNLPPGETINVQFYVKIHDPLATGVTQIANQGTVNSNELPPLVTNDPETLTPDDPSVTPITTRPVLTADKSYYLLIDADHDGSPSPGDTLLYQVAIQNTGSAAATNVNFADTPDANTTLVTGTVQTTQGDVVMGNRPDDRAISIDIGTLAGRGARATLTFRVWINNPLPIGVTHIANQGALNSNELPCVLTNDPATSASGDATVTPLPTLLHLVALKTAFLAADADANGVASPGDTLAYQVTLSNTGSLTATNVVFTDTPDAITALVAGSVHTSAGQVLQGNFNADDAVRVLIPAVPGNSAVTITFSVAITDAPANGVQQIVNQGVFSADQVAYLPTDDPLTATAGDATITPILAKPQLVIAKTASLYLDANNDGLVSPGDTLVYHISVTNTGTMPATGVVITDTPDANTQLLIGSVQASQGAVNTGNTNGDTSVRVTLGSIAARGGSASVTLRVQIASQFPALTSQVANQAWVSSNELPTSPTDDPSTAQADDATLTQITAACNVAPDQNEPDDYFTQARVIATDGSPTQHTFHIMADKDWVKFFTLAGHVYSVTTSRLSPDVDTVLQLYGQDGVTLLSQNDNYLPNDLSSRVTFVAPGTGWYFARTAHFDATYDPRKSVVCGNGYLLAVSTDQPGLWLRKTALDLNGAPLMAGDEILYRISVSNTLGVTQTNIVVTDAIPAYTTLVSGSLFSSQGAVNGPDPLVVTVGTLRPEDSAVFIFRVKVNAGVSGQTVSNIAYAASDQQPIPTSAGPVEPQPGGGLVQPGTQALSISKVANDLNGGALYTGDQIAYTITVANLLSAVQTGVVISDAMPAGVTYVPGSAASSQGTLNTLDPLPVNAGTLQPGQIVTVTFRVTVNSNAAGATVSNTAHAGSAQQPIPVTAGPVEPLPGGGKVQSGPQALGIYKTAQDVNAAPLNNDDEILYTVTVINLLAVPQTNVAIVDKIPAYTTYVTGSAQTSQGTLSGPDPLAVNVGVVQPGQTVTLSFRVRVNHDAGGRVIGNTATATSDQQPAPVQAGPVQPAPAPVAGWPESGGGLVHSSQQLLGINKVGIDINGPLLNPGDVISYVVTVRNLSGGVQTHIAITDAIPAHTTLVANSVSYSRGNLSPSNPLRLSIDNLSGGDTLTLIYQVKVDADAAGQRITNQAFAFSDQQTTSVYTPPVVVLGSGDGRVYAHSYHVYLPIVTQPEGVQ
jgi:uncharacterized repeat protein (TIGR01451 family)